MKVFLYRLVQLTWGFPQSLLGLLLLLKFRKAPHHSYKGSIVTNWPKRGGISLGMFTFVEDRLGRQESVQKHEYGHTIQSLVLGPFYLLIVGIPSYIWANLPYYVNKRKRNRIPYNRFIIEKSADRLGGNL